MTTRTKPPSGPQANIKTSKSSSSDYKSTKASTSSSQKSTYFKDENGLLKLSTVSISPHTPQLKNGNVIVGGLKEESNINTLSVPPLYNDAKRYSARGSIYHRHLSKVRLSISPVRSPRGRCDSQTGIIDIATSAILRLENNRQRVSGSKSKEQDDKQSEDSSDTAEDLKTWQRHNKSKRKTLCFNDGFRRIDFVLVNNVSDAGEKNAKLRELFEEQLESRGLVLEEDFDEDKTLRFIKIHAPWGVLTSIADIMKLSMPIATRKDTVTLQPSVWTYFSQYFDYDRSLLPDLPKYYTAWFSREKQHLFLMKWRDDFFTPAQRSYMTSYLMENTTFKSEHIHLVREYVGIQSLIAEGVYLTAYPLHSGDCDRILDDDHQKFNLRNRLYLAWAQISTICKRQPLEYIRKYFGEYIAFYFAWVELYTLMLVPVSLIGLCVIVYGLGYSASPEADFGEACDSAGTGNITMCPLCDSCNCWKLKEGCDRNRISTLIDHGLMIYFGLFMSLWSVLFEKMWKREQSRLQYHWHVSSYKQQEHVRPQFLAFRGKGVVLAVNPNNDRIEPNLGKKTKFKRQGGSFFLTVLTLFLSVFCMFLLTHGRTYIYESLVQGDNVPHYLRTPWATTGASAGINLAILLILDIAFTMFAKALTNYELPRTQSAWEDSYIIKLFIFQFMNNNIYFFHLAFIKGNFVGNPPNYTRVFGRRQEHCVLGACLAELFMNVGLIMSGKLGLNRLFALVRQIKATEKYKSYFHNIKRETRWEKDFTLAPVPELTVIGLYMEMAIQFAHVTLYATAMPLAPMIALLNNILQIKSDALTFNKIWRRPVAHRTGGISIWFSIFTFISRISILTNAFIIATTSDYVRKLVYFYHFENPDLRGFVNFTLSAFPVDEFPNYVKCEDKDGTPFQKCHSYGFVDYDPPHHYNICFYIVVSYQFIFVVSFSCAVLSINWIIDYFVPDLPSEVSAYFARENFLINKAILDLGLLEAAAESSLSDREEDHRLYSDFDLIREKASTKTSDTSKVGST